MIITFDCIQQKKKAINFYKLKITKFKKKFAL